MIFGMKIQLSKFLQNQILRIFLPQNPGNHDFWHENSNSCLLNDFTL